MNTVKLYRLAKDNKTIEMLKIKCTQSTNFFARFGRPRTTPYAHEAQEHFINQGWSRKKPTPLATSKSKLALSVRRAVLDLRTPV